MRTIKKSLDPKTKKKSGLSFTKMSRVDLAKNYMGAKLPIRSIQISVFEKAAIQF